MKNFIYSLTVLLNLLFFHSQAVTPCPYHQNEIHHIRDVAYDSILDAHKLTKETIKSFVVTAEDIAWNAVQYKSNYS